MKQSEPYGCPSFLPTARGRESGGVRVKETELRIRGETTAPVYKGQSAREEREAKRGDTSQCSGQEDLPHISK